jgi:hypothetical protein
VANPIVPAKNTALVDSLLRVIAASLLGIGPTV